MEFEVNTLFVHKPIRSCWCFCNAPPFRWLWYLHSWSQVRQKKILFGDLLQRVDKHLEQFDVVPRRLWVRGMGSLQIDVENRLIWRQTREDYFCIVIMSSLCNCRIDFMRLCSVCVCKNPRKHRLITRAYLRQNSLKLLISVPVQCCTVFPFTQFWILLIWPFRPFRPQLGLRGALPLEPASNLKTSPVCVCVSLYVM